MVHHDLATVQQYFDSVLLLNVELKGFGPTSRVFTQDMLQHTYGGRLAFLDHTIAAGATEAHGGVSL
ncbi:hypothetical protein D3C78_1800380 [compost metagenome]